MFTDIGNLSPYNVEPIYIPINSEDLFYPVLGTHPGSQLLCSIGAALWHGSPSLQTMLLRAPCQLGPCSVLLREVRMRGWEHAPASSHDCPPPCPAEAQHQRLLLQAMRPLPTSPAVSSDTQHQCHRGPSSSPPTSWLLVILPLPLSSLQRVGGNCFGHF